MREKIKNIIYSPISSQQHEIKALDMAINLHKQEDKIFWKTINMKANILDRELYDFQMLVELLQRFWPKERVDILLEAQHELMLAYRFMLIGHYNSSGKHLRSCIEHIINYLVEDPEKTWKEKIEILIEHSLYKEEELLKLDAQQVYIIYSYLSNKYTHHSDPFEVLKLDINKLREVRDLIIVITLLSARLIFGIHGKLIESHYKDEVLHPIKYEKSAYWSYILSLLSDVRFYNTMMEWWLWEKIEDKRGNKIDMTLWIDKEYHESRKAFFR